MYRHGLRVTEAVDQQEGVVAGAVSARAEAPLLDQRNFRICTELPHRS